MKYSLRSLMTFSIRDLFWITVVVAMAVGWWWVDRTRAERLAEEFESVEAAAAVMLDHLAKLEEENTQLRIQAGLKKAKTYSPNLPTSQAPAPNPPKD